MVALAPETAVEESTAVAQENVAAPEINLEERKAHIITLVADGKRDYFAAEYESASEKLGDAARISAEIFGDFAAESFDANLYYGRTLLEIARGEQQILKTAMTDVPEGDEINDSVAEQVESVDNLTEEEKEEIKDQVDGALLENVEMLETSEIDSAVAANGSDIPVEVQDDKAEESTGKTEEAESIAAGDLADKTEDAEKPAAGDLADKTEDAEKPAAGLAEDSITVEPSTEGQTEESDAPPADDEATAETNDEEAETVDEEKEDLDDDELTTMQTAWEILEVARNICDKQEENEEWDLKKADVLLTLGELSLEDENYKQATDDLDMCLALHLKHRKNYDRAVAEVYITIARAHTLNDDYENAEKFYVKTRETLQANIAAAKEEEPTPDNLKNISEVEELIAEIDMKIEDARQSGKQVEKEMGDIREKLGLGKATTLQAKSNEPAGDITNLVRRKGEKRAASTDADEEAKKPKTDVADTPAVVDTAQC